MTVNTEKLWSALREARIVDGDVPGMETLASPWYVRVMLGFSGWLAALFILLFIGAALAFIMRSNAASLIAGAVLIGAAFAILNKARGDFVEQLALATSIAGQGLVIYVIFKSSGWGGAGAWSLTALLHAMLAIVMPNFIHRVFSSLFAAFSLSFALAATGAPYLLSGALMFPVAYIWLNEFSHAKYMQAMRAIGYGLALGLVNIKGSALFANDMWWLRRTSGEVWARPWMGEALAGAAIAYVIWQLLVRNGYRLNDRIAIAAFAATGVVFIASLEANGITAGIMVMLLGFAGGNRVLTGLGIAATLFYVSSWYYMTDTTLLVKSQTLLATGLVLLLARWLLLNIVSKQEEDGDAR